MPNPERPGITSVIRTVADIVDDAVRYGLPAPQTVNVGTYGTPYLIMAEFEQVDAWGEYLEAPVERYLGNDGGTEHIATEHIAGPDGVRVRVTTNRPHVCEAAS